jgi:hypothetical protein
VWRAQPEAPLPPAARQFGVIVLTLLQFLLVVLQESRIGNTLVVLAKGRTAPSFVARIARTAQILRFADVHLKIVLLQLPLTVHSLLACTACTALVRF